MKAPNDKNREAFDSTIWSKVRLASADESKPQKKALNELAEVYFPPIRALVAMNGKIDPNKREDILQETMALIFSREKLRTVDAKKGKFRNFIKTVLKRRVVDDYRKRHSQRYNEHQTDALEKTHCENLAASDTWELEFDRALALRHLTTVQEHMEQESSDPAAFGVTWNEMLNLQPGTQEEQALMLGLEPAAYRKRLFQMRTQFKRRFRAEVAKGLIDPSEQEDEVRYLLQLAMKELPESAPMGPQKPAATNRVPDQSKYNRPPTGRPWADCAQVMNEST
jgi:DNA-directed RNA polymerase specialized sigma24 family protein